MLGEQGATLILGGFVPGALAAGGRITCRGQGCHQGCAVFQVSPMETSREGREGLQKALCNS